jgi:hypothetical protein
MKTTTEVRVQGEVHKPTDAEAADSAASRSYSPDSSGCRLGPRFVAHGRTGWRACFRLLPVIAAMAISVAFPMPGRTTSVSSPSSVYWPTLDRTDVFVIGSDGNLYHKYWNASYWAWESFGTPASGISVANPSAVYWPTLDRTDVFVTGSDGNLYHKYWNASYWAWEFLGTPASGISVANPSAVYWPTLDRVYVFATDSTGHILFDKYWNATGGYGRTRVHTHFPGDARAEATPQ